MTPTDLIAAATSIGATVIRSAGATVIVLVAPAEDAAELVPEADAARLAKCSVRTLRKARRDEEIPAYGRQRSRCYRRADLTAWIESRKVAPIAGVDDLDMRRRMARLEKARATKRSA